MIQIKIFCFIESDSTYFVLSQLGIKLLLLMQQAPSHCYTPVFPMSYFSNIIRVSLVQTCLIHPKNHSAHLIENGVWPRTTAPISQYAKVGEYYGKKGENVACQVVSMHLNRVFIL